MKTLKFYQTYNENGEQIKKPLKKGNPKTAVKILLINPPIRTWSEPNIPPLGLGYIASVLEYDGHKVEILDINAHRYSQKQVEKIIKNSDADFFGTGAIVTKYRYIKWLLGIIKKYHAEKKIMTGGSVATSIPHILLRKTKADIAVLGEGEITISHLVDNLVNKKSLKEVEGIWYKENGKIRKNPKRASIKDLDTIPLPARHLMPMDIYLKNPVGAPNIKKWDNGATVETNVITTNIIASRGCPYKCIYCYHDFLGQGYRWRSPKAVVEEIKMLKAKYKVNYVHFMDDEFVAHRPYVLEFCRRMIKENLGITWGCTGRVNLMSEDLIIKMKKAGCILIGYGIESGSQKILNTLRKLVTVEQAKKAIRLTQKHLGWADCSFMIGSPGEDEKTIQETIDFCKEVNLAPEVIFFLTPYPGTEAYELAKSLGKIKDEEKYISKLGEQGEKIRINFTKFSNRQLYAIQKKMIAELKAWNIKRHKEEI